LLTNAPASVIPDDVTEEQATPPFEAQEASAAAKTLAIAAQSFLAQPRLALSLAL
jgi:hypothetical protein